MRIVALLLGLCAAKVVFLAEVCRHGARSPLHLMKWDQDGRWSESSGQLTAAGMRQHYLLGSELRKRYPDLFNRSYSEDLFRVVSTDVDRTIMSAEAQLLGLFPKGQMLTNASYAVPPLNISSKDDSYLLDLETEALPNRFQPIAVHSNNAAPLLTPQLQVCPKLHSLDQEAETGSAARAAVRHYPEVLAAVKEVLGGSEQEAVKAMREVLDSVEANVFEGKELPQAFTKDLLGQMKELNDQLFSLSYQPDSTGRLWASQFLSELTEVLEAVSSQSESTVFRLYSAHDTTVAGVLSGLEAFNSTVPPFASTILFEVSDSLTLRVLYNDQPLHLPGCASLQCPLSTAISYMRNRAYSDFPSACGLSQADSASGWAKGMAWTALTVLLVGMLMAVAAVLASFRVTKRRGHLQEARDVVVQQSDR